MQAYASISRPKLDLIINWNYLMQRKDFKTGQSVIHVSMKYYGGEWFFVDTLDLAAGNIPFYQKTVSIDLVYETPTYVRLQIVNPRTKEKFLLEPLEF